MAGGLGHAHALERPEAPPPAPRAAGDRLGDRCGPGRRRRPRRGRRLAGRRRRLRGRRRSRSRRSRSAPATPSPPPGRALEGFDGHVLVLDAAAPLLTAEHLATLVAEHEREQAARDDPLLRVGPTAAVRADHPRRRRHGRGDRRGRGTRPPSRRAIRELNSSIYVFEAAPLWEALGRLDAHNAQGELYLTDTIAQHRRRRRSRRRLGLPRRARDARDQHARRAGGRGAPSSATGSTRRTCSPA